MTEAPVNETVGVSYGGGPGDVTGFYLRCQGELLGLCGTLKIVIPVENYPQKPKDRLADYHPLWMGGGVD